MMTHDGASAQEPPTCSEAFKNGGRPCVRKLKDTQVILDYIKDNGPVTSEDILIGLQRRYKVSPSRHEIGKAVRKLLHNGAIEQGVSKGELDVPVWQVPKGVCR